jgi:hypothetical protein
VSEYVNYAEGVRPSEALVRCTNCREALVLPRRRTKAPPFCSKKPCRAAYSRWRYQNDDEFRDRQIEGVLRRRRQNR